MQIIIIVDPAGSVLAACRRTSEGNLQVGIKPVEQTHALHELDVPPALEQLSLHELVKRVRIGANRRPHLVPS
jgi:hypothetical protein